MLSDEKEHPPLSLKVTTYEARLALPNGGKATEEQILRSENRNNSKRAGL